MNRVRCLKIKNIKRSLLFLNFFFFTSLSTFNVHSEEFLGPLLSGVYQVEMKIGEKTFQDLLVFRPGALGEIQGSFTVPGVFTSPFKGILKKSGELMALKFEILAKEGPVPYKVYFSSLFSPQGSSGRTQEQFTGMAKLEDGTFLGSFTATKYLSKIDCELNK